MYTGTSAAACSMRVFMDGRWKKVRGGVFAHGVADTELGARRGKEIWFLDYLECWFFEWTRTLQNSLN